MQALCSDDGRDPGGVLEAFAAPCSPEQSALAKVRPWVLGKSPSDVLVGVGGHGAAGEIPPRETRKVPDGKPLCGNRSVGGCAAGADFCLSKHVSLLLGKLNRGSVSCRSSSCIQL